MIYNRVLKNLKNIYNQNHLRFMTFVSPLGSLFNEKPKLNKQLFNFNQNSVGLFGIKEFKKAEGFYEIKDDVENTVNLSLNEVLSNDTPKRKFIQIFEHISNKIYKAADLAEFVRTTHPDQTYREAADYAFTCLSKIVQKLDTMELYKKINRMTYFTTNSDLEFWKSEWDNRSIGFHKDIRHPMLVKHHEKLFNKKPKCKIFFPLCGKAIDMFWLSSLGHEIVGVEGVQTAIEEFFNESKLEYTVRDVDEFKVYESNDKRVKLYLGDFFKFNSKYESSFDAVWDRGSLVAIAPNDRQKYVEIMLGILAKDCIYLLDTFDYDPNEYSGPPHLIPEDLINQLFGKSADKKLLTEKVALNKTLSSAHEI